MADYNINAVTRRIVYTGSAGVGPYAFSFEILTQTDVDVYFNTTLLTITTDYTVTINANGTGSVTIVTGSSVPSTPDLNDRITIVGARDIERMTDFVTAGELRASALNEQLDALTIFDQQLLELSDRAIRAPVTDPVSVNMELPAQTARADKILKFDSNGNVAVESAEVLAGGAIVGANFTNNVFTGTGSTTTFTMTVAPGSKNNAQVYIDGVYQLKSSFSVSGTTLTFTEAPPLNAQIEVVIGNAIDTLDADSGNINYNQGGTGAQTRTVESKLQEFVSVKDFGAVGDGVADDTAAWANFIAYSNGRKLIPAGSYLITGVVYTYPNDVIYDNVQLYPPGQVGTENRAVENSFFQNQAAIRVGASDTTPQNDERNFWRGLPDPDAWGDTDNIGLFSAAFNRNGASYAGYSTTFGHDCVTYGVASISAGAGSCTGDPDNPTSPAFEGYCSTAFGKNVLAKGEKSAAFCEETQSLSRASFTAGYSSIAGEYSGSGLGATALGAYASAYGEGSFAAGKYIQSTNGGYTIGSGINSGNKLNNTRANGIALGANTVYAPFYVMPGSGTVSPNDAGYAEFFVSPVRFTELLGGTTLFTCAQARPVITNAGGSGYGAVQFEATINGVMTSVCRADSDSNIPSFLPTADNSRRLGAAALRWEVVFAATGTINTSDANEKEQVRNLIEQEIAVAKKLKGLVRAFKFKDAVSSKGTNARIHFGVIAQDVKAAFESEGLVAEEYGLLCLDTWEDTYDKEGNITIKAGSRYGVRYEELLAFIIAAL